MSFLFYRHFWTIIALCTATITAASMFADRRRHRRQDLNRVGFMPWTGISVFATLATVLSMALAIKSG
jgi:hypothetical protein